MTEDSPRDEHRARDEHRGGSAGADLRQPPPGDLVLPNPSEDEAADEVFDDLLEDYIPDPQKRSLVVRRLVGVNSQPKHSVRIRRLRPDQGIPTNRCECDSRHVTVA